MAKAKGEDVEVAPEVLALDEREAALNRREEDLQQMERDIQEKCAEIDAVENSLDKREKELATALGITEDSDLFLKFYENVDKIYTLWCANKGTQAGLIESVQKILDARQSMQKVDDT